MNTAEWHLITQTLNHDDPCNIFMDEFLKIYDEAFPLQKMATKTKNIVSSGITMVIKKIIKEETVLRYFNFEPSSKLQWWCAWDLFGSQIPVATGGFELWTPCIRSSYLTHSAILQIYLTC